MMEITKDHIEKNQFSRPGEKLQSVKAIILHYTACPGASAKNIRDYFQNLKKQNPNDNIADRSASAHYAVDDDSIIEIIPPDEVAYHVGAKQNQYSIIAKSLGDRSPNNYTIGIEMCHSDESGKISPKTIGNTMMLTRYLLDRYELTNNDIYRHYDITGKNCPKYFAENEREWIALKNLI